jgi:hypothetical protein
MEGGEALIGGFPTNVVNTPDWKSKAVSFSNREPVAPTSNRPVNRSSLKTAKRLSTKSSNPNSPQIP